MFTGIIEATAKVLRQGDGLLILERPKLFDDVNVGSSITVSGVCLTVTRLDAHSLTFDMMPETLAKTTLGTWAPGDTANLERALPAHGRFEGHVVQGHVEGVGKVVRADRCGEDVRLVITIPPDLRRAITPKGSLCLDGVSLTVAEVGPETCTVALIPFTLEHTTLGRKLAGDLVNVETDVLVRTLLAAHGERLEKL